MPFGIDKNGVFTMNSVTSTAASGIPGSGDAERFSVQVVPVITGTTTPGASARLQESNDGVNWTTISTTLGVVSGTAFYLSSIDGIAGEYRLELTTTSGGIDADVHYVTKRWFN